MQLTATSSTATRASSADRALLAEATRVYKLLVAQHPHLGAGADLRTTLREWAAGIVDLTPGEIDRGISDARSAQYAPGIGEFRRLCRPALDPEYAFAEAQAGLRARDRDEVGEWSHPAVWRAASAMAWDIKTKSYREVRAAWERALSKEFEHGWGEDVPAVPKRVEHRPTTSYMPAAVRARLAELNPAFGRRHAS
jgi:hypothetical protein